jgi:hypothetical protein
MRAVNRRRRADGSVLWRGVNDANVLVRGRCPGRGYPRGGLAVFIAPGPESGLRGKSGSRRPTGQGAGERRRDQPEGFKTRAVETELQDTATIHHTPGKALGSNSSRHARDFR